MKDTIMQRIFLMSNYLLKGREEVRPSKFWNVLNKSSIKYLKKSGYKNFKRTLALYYFCFIFERQILFLLINLNPLTTLKCLIRSLFLPQHKLYYNNKQLNRLALLGINLTTYLIWEYVKENDKEKLLDQFEEPLIGNPPRIYLDKKIISQDIANSILEFKSIFNSVEKEEVKTICEIGAGSGRDAFVFINLLKKLEKYIIIDIPPALVVCERYLSEIFPNKKIFKFRIFKSFGQIKNEFNEAEILFFTPNQIELLPSHTVDLMINISSLHEMRLNQIKYYFKQIERLVKIKKYFYLKEWKVSHIPYENIYIRTKDYPITSKWKVIYLREPKVQINFFEQLLQLKNG